MKLSTRGNAEQRGATEDADPESEKPIKANRSRPACQRARCCTALGASRRLATASDAELICHLRHQKLIGRAERVPEHLGTCMGSQQKVFAYGGPRSHEGVSQRISSKRALKSFPFDQTRERMLYISEPLGHLQPHLRALTRSLVGPADASIVNAPAPRQASAPSLCVRQARRRAPAKQDAQFAQVAEPANRAAPAWPVPLVAWLLDSHRRCRYDTRSTRRPTLHHARGNSRTFHLMLACFPALAALLR